MIINPKYIDDHENDIGQILAMKTIMCTLYFLENANPTLKFKEIVQPYRHFVIFAAGAYHGGLNADYKIAKITNFANYLFCNVGKLTFRDTNSQRLLKKRVLPVKLILWCETTDQLSFLEKCSSFRDTIYFLHLARELYKVMHRILCTAERCLHHLSNNDKRTASAESEKYAGTWDHKCFTCKRDTFSFVQKLCDLQLPPYYFLVT